MQKHLEKDVNNQRLKTLKIH